MVRVLGVSAYYHDAAACLIEDGEIIAAAQEERFTRVKHDSSFPTNAVRYCLAEAGQHVRELDAVAFYDKPILKFHRILETHLSTAPAGLRQFMSSIPTWMNKKLWIPPQIETALEVCGLEEIGEMFFPEHHESHAASAFYPSPFPEAAILTNDGVGEWACATIADGEGADLRILQEQHFPHSLGLLYTAFTYYLGFRVNSGEYKVMGLAPYGEGRFTQRIFDELLDLKADGSFRLNMDYFGYLDDLVMIREKFCALFEEPARAPESELTRFHLDVARSIQEVTEDVVVRMARHARRRTGRKNLCLAGGVALNCVANGRLLREGIFEDIWVQPAATDAGGALGAALAVWHSELGHPRNVSPTDRMRGSLLGPEFSAGQIREYLDENGFVYTELADEAWADEIARRVADGNVIGLFQGRMEFGPRALGNRSIIGDPRSEKMQSIINLKIKARESFRPFAPACMEERAGEYFELDRPSPYMLLVAPVQKTLREPLVEEEGGVKERDLDLSEWVGRRRSSLPAITHVDYSARVQTVTEQSNPRFYSLLHAFERITGTGVLINTSFNVRGEPIVCTPSDAYRCFMRTEMDDLVLGPFLLEKVNQGMWSSDQSWNETIQLG